MHHVNEGQYALQDRNSRIYPLCAIHMYMYMYMYMYVDCANLQLVLANGIHVYYMALDFTL